MSAADPKNVEELKQYAESRGRPATFQGESDTILNSDCFVFLGPPASGKGTQGRRLADDRGLAYLSTGGLLREALRLKTEAGKAARPYLDKGRYVPDEIMLPLVGAWLKNQNGGWILDGFPRTLAQAVALDRELGGEKASALRSVYLSVPHAELRQRVGGRIECESCHWVSSEEAREAESTTCKKCGGKMVTRADDDVERFEKRYREFSEMTMPLVNFYQKSARLLEVDGSLEPDSVAKELTNKLAH